jgi:transcriptional regulator with XRE-family HTH domain
MTVAMFLPEIPAGPSGLGGRLRAARALCGLSQRDLESAGVTAAYICRIERGTKAPSVEVIRRLAVELGVSAHWLETGEDERWERFSPAELAAMRSALARQGGPATARLAGEIDAALRRQTALGLADVA